jgi:hypothetical protein
MLRVLAAAIGLAALIAVPVLAEEQEVEAKDSGQIEFTMPSGNIGCLYTPAGGTDVYETKDGGPELICERVEPSYVTVILTADGEAEVIEDPGEQGCCGAENIFEYGNTITLEGFVCSAETTGLTCESEAGYGFSMARAGIETFGPDEGEIADEDEQAAGDAEEDDGTEEE